MSSQKPKSDFEKLKALWYKKLEKSGFNDIEQDDDHLKAWSNKLGQVPPEVWQAKQAYFNMAERFLADYEFSDRIEEIIWEYHANGLSCREITKVLNKTRRKQTNRTSVWATVKRLENIMKTMYLVGHSESEQ